MVHHLVLRPRPPGLSFLSIDELRLRRAITEMLNLPSFVGRAVNTTRRRGLNAMLP